MIRIDHDLCELCGTCIDQCPVQALDIVGTQLVWSESDCISCGACCDACPNKALTLFEE